jgi:hypothetical protein
MLSHCLRRCIRFRIEARARFSAAGPFVKPANAHPQGAKPRQARDSRKPQKTGSLCYTSGVIIWMETRSGGSVSGPTHTPGSSFIYLRTGFDRAIDRGLGF